MRLYWVDAFADVMSTGNPAAVISLGSAPFPTDAMCQRIAFENGLSETAFYRSTSPGHYHLRWFTPEQEVDLCGHATLASGFVALRCDETGPDFNGTHVIFDTISGPLHVQGIGTNAFQLLFPSRPPVAVLATEIPLILFEALGLPRSAALYVGKARDYLIEVSTPEQVLALRPDFKLLATVTDALCVIVSSKTHLSSIEGPHVVSRVWCPGCSVPEDPVTGSAHCTILPYFAEKMGLKKMVCRQASARGGTLFCELLDGGSVSIQGNAVLYMKGEIFV